MTNEEKAKLISGLCQNCFLANCSTSICYPLLRYNSAIEMAKWKDEQHEQSVIDLNCKLEEQQANYEELKRCYDEAVERERIATKIINELRERNNKTTISDADRIAEDYRKFPTIREI